MHGYNGDNLHMDAKNPIPANVGKGLNQQQKWLSLQANWAFRQVGTESWHKARVPGCNFTDLLRRQQIPDPFFRDNEKKVQWIEKESWEYKSTFFCSPSDLAYRGKRMIFDGLDTFARVYLNGSLILESNNMFVQHTVDPSHVLQAGDNTLHIVFASPINEVAERANAAGFIYPAGNDHSDHKRSVFCRKAPYHFGWDWGPRLVTSGIWRPIWLVFFEHTRVSRTSISTSKIEKGRATIISEWVIESLEKDALLLHLDIGNGAWTFQEEVVVDSGTSTFSFTHVIDQPQKWWPRGYGSPHLYLVKREVHSSWGQLKLPEQKLGIRTIKLIREPDEMGTSYFFEVNGVPVFCKGANYIPQDSFLDRVTPDRYRKMMQHAVDANMNMLRVWGGGVYEDDLFYDLADEAGIMIWQDFMFGCSMYPGDMEFLGTVREEAIYNINRLKHHAALALWCGNNEIAVGWDHWGWQKEYGYTEAHCAKMIQDYKSLFEELLPSIVSNFDPVHDYVSTSPLIDYGDVKQYGAGDVHYWGVWHEEEPFETFRTHIPRFMSEYGFQSFPTLPTLNRYATTEDWGLETAVMQVHQKHPRGNGIIRKYLLASFNEPVDFPSFLYVSQVLQAQGIRIAIEAHRAAKPFCMGTLYWQLNDCWPVASWSGMDYYGQWKALHYAVRKAYQETLLVVDIAGKEWIAHLISDQPDSYSVDVEVSLHHLDIGRLAKVNRVFNLTVDKNITFGLEALQKASSGQELSYCFLHYQVLHQGDILYQHHTFLVPVKSISLERPTLQQTYRWERDVLELVVESDVLVKNIYFWIEPGNGWFSDNFFDLFPGEQKTIEIKGLTSDTFDTHHVRWTSIYHACEQPHKNLNDL